MLYDNKIMIECCAYFLYRELYGCSSAGNGDYLQNHAHLARGCDFFFFLVPWKDMVFLAVTNGLGCGSQNRTTVTLGTERVSQ